MLVRAAVYSITIDDHALQRILRQKIKLYKETFEAVGGNRSLSFSPLPPPPSASPWADVSLGTMQKCKLVDKSLKNGWK